ncbi:hypothetical protein OESDEN_11363 [Oesophagostomum dentatum]|uniref:Uncharacterized protein n=1 Tax=Oesophagostomum dentatum TaxID=61180 RepID=A0A0B1SU37_OESDE|nr:hypothetical protein OESDEN_11363 [Oesophagostomum dentatum]
MKLLLGCPLFYELLNKNGAKRDIGTIVSNCLPFYLSGSDSDVYPLRVLVQDLCSLALMEVEENSQKLSKTSSLKTCSLELTISVLSKVCSKRLLCTDYIDFLRFVSRIVETPLVQSQRWVEDDVTSVLVKFMNISACFIASDPLNEIWSLVWRRLPIAAETGGKSFGNYLRVARCILKYISQTTMVADDAGPKLVSDMIEKLFATIGDKGSKWNSHVECVFELLTLTIDDWGIECRDVILRHCIPFASLLTAKLDFSAAASNDLESAWNFFDRLIHLAIPDCKASCIVPNEAYHLAEAAYEVVRRLLVIVNSSASTSVDDMDATLAVYTQHAKRRKEHSLLDIITEWTFVDGIDYSDRPHLVVSCLSIGYEITSKWSHRIEPFHLNELAAKLWNSKHLIKQCDSYFITYCADYTHIYNYSDWQLSSYCQLLDNLLKLGALDDICAHNTENGMQTVRSLWKLALSSAHAACSFDAACSLIMSIIKKFLNIIGDDEDITDSVCDILSRTTLRHGPVLYELLIFILSELEFDELRPFPGVSDKKKGIGQWRFRCQLAEWLLRHIEPECNPSEVLYAMCQLHPRRSSKLPSSPENTTGIERDLELFGFFGNHPTRETRSIEAPLLVIPDLVSYISQLYAEVWSDNGLVSESYVTLWCSYLKFLSKLNISLESSYVDLISVMEVWISDWVRKADASSLSHISLHNVNPHLVSSDILRTLIARLDDCPALGAYLAMFPVELNVSAAIIRDVMSGIGKCYDIHDDSHVRRAAGNLLERFTAEVDTVPDLLLLLDECGNIIDKDSRKRLECRISQLIEEDLASGEYDANEAGIYRRRLGTCSLRLSEVGITWLFDFKTKTFI